MSAVGSADIVSDRGRYPNRYRPGQSGNRDGYRALLKRRSDIRAGLLAYYDFSSLLHAVLLEIVVKHLNDAGHARTKVDRVRASNAAARLLSTVPRREQEQPPPLSMADIERLGRGK